MEEKSLFVRWRANFLTGLFIVLPAVISVAVLVWLFGTVANITDTLLFFLPHEFTHRAGPNGPGTGPMYWYWSLAALTLAVLLTSVLGRLARNYFGKKTIEWVEAVMLRIPLFNKIYGAIKQVNEAFSSGSKNSFKTVVLVEFPREGMYSVGFLTSEQRQEVQAKTKERVVSVFIPTTPNPTSGFLVLVPEDKVTKLDMSVPDAIKYIVSLGALSPNFVPPPPESK
ncbi:MAG: DUF502 domain-containing protein [Verrucomicrobia bacterium]|nr:DUF502 domain-containing protein [Verrucomicrobiota bacterium]